MLSIKETIIVIICYYERQIMLDIALIKY